MKKTLVIAVLIIAAFSSGVSADEKSHREAALKMMEMFNMRLLYNQAVGSVYQASMQKFESKEPNAEKQKYFQDLMRETKKIVLEVYPYEKIRDITIDIYIKNFSEKEIYGVIDFYKSPLGQKVLAKFPQMMQESNMRIQAFFMEKMPEIEKRMDAFLAEYNKKQRVK